MRKLLLTLAAATLFLVVALPSEAGDVASYTVNLDGAQEVPGPGDEDGTGTVHLQLGTVSNEVCVDELTVANIDTPTLMHIHVGPVGVAGDIVVNLTPALTSLPFCTTIDAALMEQLITNAANYYVNIHNEPFPAGAIRGQLPGQVPPTSPSTDDTSTTSTTSGGGTGGTAGTGAARPTFTG